MSKTVGITMGIGLASIGAVAYMAVRPAPPKMPQFIRARDDQHCEIMVNTNSIRWIAKYDTAYYVCARPVGCVNAPYASDKFIVDPVDEPESFAVLSNMRS
jgi:hypothetical protein